MGKLRQQPYSIDVKLEITKQAKKLAAETAERLQREDPAAAIDVSLVVALCLGIPPSSVQKQLHEMQQRIDLLQLQQESAGQMRIEHAAAPSASSIFAVCATVARLAFATAVGALLGGPFIALTLGEPLLDKAFEGAVGGLLGGATSEINESATEWAERLWSERNRSTRDNRDD